MLFFCLEIDVFWITSGGEKSCPVWKWEHTGVLLKICLCLDFKYHTKVKSETGHPSWVAFGKIYLFSRDTEELLRVVFQFAYFDFVGKRWSYFFMPTRPRPVDERQLYFTSAVSDLVVSRNRGVPLKYFCRKSTCRLFWTCYFTRTLELLGEFDQLKDLRKKQCLWGVKAFLAFSRW